MDDDQSGITLIYEWADGDRFLVEVHATDAYPDALNEARATAHREFHEGMRMLASLEGSETTGDATD